MTTFAMPAPSPIVHTLLVLTASRDAGIEVTPDTVRVRLGLGWRTEFARDSVTGAEQIELSTMSLGAHGWGGRWLVNTTTTGLVRLTLDPAATGRCYGIPHRLTELTLSVEDPEGFVQELGFSDSV